MQQDLYGVPKKECNMLKNRKNRKDKITSSAQKNESHTFKMYIDKAEIETKQKLEDETTQLITGIASQI